MDKYEGLVSKNCYSVKRHFALPKKITTNENNQTISTGYDGIKTNRCTTDHLKIKLSFDNYDNFIRDYKLGKYRTLPLYIVLYDEDDKLTNNDIRKRYYFLKAINQMNILEIQFNLSDKTMPLYNVITNKINWHHQSKTKINMTIDRNPIKEKDLRLDEAKGEIILPEEKLIWLPTETLRKLKGNVKEDVLTDTKNLQILVYQFYFKLNQLYEYKDLTEKDKLLLAYAYVKKHIKYASEAITIVDGRQTLYNPNGINNWASEPWGTYKHKRGICAGQARLMQILLNNPYIKSDTTTISGITPEGHHKWVGTIIDGRLYQTCTTMKGYCDDLDKAQYIPNPDQQYPLLYVHDSMNKREKDKVQEHILSLKKK